MLGKVCDPRRDGLTSFGAAIAYIADPHKTHHVVLNGMVSLATAAALMRFTARANTRCRAPLYHLVVSWREGEEPTDEDVEAAARHLLRRLGFHDHLWVLAVHRSATGVHVHVVICRVHPETHRAHAPRSDYFGLDFGCREIELEQGWAHDRGRYVVEAAEDGWIIVARRTERNAPRPSDRALRYERATGEMSFQSWVATAPAEAVKRARTWGEVHAGLGDLGIAIRPRGSGHILVDLADPAMTAKLSHMGLGGVAKIERRLGEAYAPPEPLPASPTPSRGDDARPPQDGIVRLPEPARPERDPAQRDERRMDRDDQRRTLIELYRTSVADGEARLRRARRAAWETQRNSERDRRATLQVRHRDRRTEIDAAALPPVERRARLAASKAAALEDRARLLAVFRGERQALRDRFAGHAHTRWIDFLQARAEAGDRAAQAALRGIRYRNRRADAAVDGPAIDRSPPGLADDAPVSPVAPEPIPRSPTPCQTGGRLVDHPRRRASAPSPMAGDTGRTVARLDDHYGRSFDRTVAPLIRQVRWPLREDDPLRLILVTGEALRDAGDRITVESAATVTPDAVAVFVAMVQANGWPAVELFGEDDWIAAASRALDAAGIPWSVEGEPRSIHPDTNDRRERSPEGWCDAPAPSAPAHNRFQEFDIGASPPAPPAVDGSGADDAGFQKQRIAPHPIDGNVGTDPSSRPNADPELGEDLAEVGVETPSGAFPQPPATRARDADEPAGTDDPIEALRDALLSTRRVAPAIDPALEALAHRPAPPASRPHMALIAWLTRAPEDKVYPIEENGDDRRVENGADGGARDRSGTDARSGDAPGGTTGTGSLHAHPAVGADRRADRGADDAPRSGAGPAERPYPDPRTPRPADGSDPGLGGDGRQARRSPGRGPAALDEAGLIRPAAAAPVASPPRDIALVLPPKPVVAYAERLREWQRRKRVPAMGEAALAALREARAAVERLEADADGEGVDARVAAMLGPIDPSLLDTHAAAVDRDRKRHAVLASNAPSSGPVRPKPSFEAPEPAKEPRRPRGRGRD